MSPFGARGANSGVQDAENLAWKLAAVVAASRRPMRCSTATPSEREYAADENIRNSTRATDFITPKSEISRLFRDAVLELAKTQPFARTLVNSGRLSVPATLHGSVLNTPDAEAFAGRMVPGAAAADAPLKRAEWHDALGCCANSAPTSRPWSRPVAKAMRLRSSLDDVAEGGTSLKVTACRGECRWRRRRRADRQLRVVLAQRYDLVPGTVYLLRPDRHVCARWRQADRRGPRSRTQ